MTIFSRLEELRSLGLVAGSKKVVTHLCWRLQGIFIFRWFRRSARMLRRAGMRLRSAIGRLLLTDVGKKNFDGSLFDRLHGLETILDDSENATVLDIGCSEGLVAYEFCRRGASLIHGIELDKERVWFARRLFRDVPVESAFLNVNIGTGLASVKKKSAFPLLEQYDIVLFLGVYHHLRKQMGEDRATEIVREIAETASRLLAVRTDLVHEIDSVIREADFDLMEDFPAKDNVGQLRIYRRGTRRSCEH